MKRPLGTGKALLVAATVAAATHADATERGLTGQYVVVAFREITDPEFPDLEDYNDQDWIGRIVDFDALTYWFDGDPCPVSHTANSDELFVDLDDPALSDLLLSYSSAAETHRTVRSMSLDCGGRAISSVKLIVQLDKRVLVTTTYESNTIAILEKPLDAKEALQFEAALSATGYDPGAVDGVIDEGTRNAIAALALDNGARSGLKRGVITDSLLSFLADKLH